MDAGNGSVQTSAGRIAYVDTGGTGPVVVLVHGLAMDGRRWGGVVSELDPDYRCVLPPCRWAPIVSRCAPMRTSRYAAW